jgi:hypothetical protein
MQFNWFRRSGILFLPKSVIGWIILLGCLCLAVYLFIQIDSRSHSASDTLRPFFIYLFLILLFYSFIALLSSKATNHHKK